MPTAFYGGFGAWWDMPADRHSRGANFSFADGHVEHWKWKAPKRPTGFTTYASGGDLEDYNRVASGIKQHMD
jgi:prepilin-type processing-associated H-X9-DG protein